jgi:hypothetical protein
MSALIIVWNERSLRRTLQCKAILLTTGGRARISTFTVRADDLFENAGTPKDKQWMIIGPAEYELPCCHWQLEALAFFDQLLYGVANGYANQSPVRYLEGWRGG